MSRPLRFGILGCARIVRRAVIGAFRQAPTARLSAIASRDAVAARAWADEFGIPAAYDSYEALLADRDIDAVYIPLPNELHLPWTVASAKAGKHVLCEKPLALDAHQAQTMRDECCRHGVILIEAFMWRHHPRVAHARKLLADGLLGELRLVTMDFSFDIDRGDWRLEPRHGGGVLSDLGCYGVNAARLFAGAEPVEIVARAARYRSGVDMTLAMLLRFPGDCMALLNSSFECPYRNRLEIVGTQGAISFPAGVLPRGETELIVRSGGDEETIHFPASDQYAHEIECFCASVAAGRLLDPAEDGLSNMKVLDAIRHAIGDRPC